MTLRTKIMLSMIIPILLLCIVGVVGISSLKHLERAAGRILSHNYGSIQDARSMQRTIAHLEVSFGRSGKGIWPLQPEIDNFERSLKQCEHNITEPGEDQILEDIRHDWIILRNALANMDGQSATVNPVELQHHGFEFIHTSIERLVKLNEDAMFTYETDTRHIAKLMRLGVGGSLLAAFIALALFSLASAHRISKPIVGVASRLHHALNPQLADQGYVRGRTDEIELLREELEALLSRLARYEDEQNKRLLHLQTRLAFVINEILEGLVLIDDQKQILAVNRVAGQILGKNSAEGRHLNELELRDDVKKVLLPLMDGTFQTERDLDEIQFAVDDQERVYRPRVLTVAGREGAIEGYLILFWDVTEQRQFEESRRRFISMLSHQLKTPMTSLTMSINLLREKVNSTDKEDAEQEELMAIASEDCNSLAGLISELIDASYEVTTNLSLRPRDVNLIQYLRASLKPLIPQAKDRGIELILPPENESVYASVDPVKFSWVVTNIAGNALRYTASGGRIAVSVTAISVTAHIEISDTGAGIAQSDLDHIFEPYITIDSFPHRGTHGLGLAIAKEIVTAHNGTIDVESKLGTGTTFHIRIPAMDGVNA